MKILFTICGRAGSKGIKNKNIREFVSKPLPYYTMSAIELYLSSAGESIDADVVVNTDSMELIDLVKKYKNNSLGVNVIERSPGLAGDVVGKIAVIEDCLNQMQAKYDCKYDMVVDLDITSPLRTVDDIKKLIDKQIEAKADVTTSVTTSRRNPYFNQLMKCEKGYKKVIDSNYTSRQQAPELFDMNASLYAYSPDFLHSGKGVLDGYCECIEMYDTGILDLDHENDFELMQVIAAYLFEKNKDFAEVYDNI